MKKDDCPNCEYYDSPNGFHFKTKECDECKKNPMLTVVNTIIAVTALKQSYVELAESVMFSNRQMKKLPKTNVAVIVNSKKKEEIITAIKKGFDEVRR